MRKFQIGDLVRLNSKANNWRHLGAPFYKSDNLKIDVYTIKDTTFDGNIQIVCVEEGNDLSYPDWCFDLVKSSNSGLYELDNPFLIEIK